MRFLFTRRWVLFALAVGLLAFLSVRLGEWQFDRLHDRETRNESIRANLAADPAPVEDVFSTDRALPADREWIRVTVRGEYDADGTVVVRYQTRDGQSGVDVVTPLMTGTGTGLLVDRGWVSTDNTGTAPTDLPAPPAGPVTVTGWARADATGRGIAVADGSTRAVSSREIGQTLDYPLYQGFVHAEQEQPQPADTPIRAETPDLGEGPHFFYGIQWWFFGALAIFGFGYLAFDEVRRKRRTPSTEDTPVQAL